MGFGCFGSACIIVISTGMDRDKHTLQAGEGINSVLAMREMFLKAEVLF